MSVEGLELAVQVELLVDGVAEPAESRADVLIGTCANDVELIGVAEICQFDARPIERFLGYFLAVELAAVDRWREKVDERRCARLGAEEVDRRFADEGVTVASDIEGDLVERGLDQSGALAGFLAGEVIPGVHP